MAQLDNMNEQEQMQMLVSQLQDSNLRQSVMQYINQTANGLDKDANSKALIETLARESVHNQKSTAMWKSRTKKSVAVGVVDAVVAPAVRPKAAVDLDLELADDEVFADDFFVLTLEGAVTHRVKGALEREHERVHLKIEVTS